MKKFCFTALGNALINFVSIHSCGRIALYVKNDFQPIFWIENRFFLIFIESPVCGVRSPLPRPPSLLPLLVSSARPASFCALFAASLACAL